MNSRERLLTAIDRRVPDHLPATHHFVMPYFLDRYMQGISVDEYFDRMQLDPILWTISHRPDTERHEFYDPSQKEIAFLESRRISSENWRLEVQDINDPRHRTTRYSFVTPAGKLTMVLQSNDYTSWVVEPLIKDKRDIDLIGKYATHPKCNVPEINQQAAKWGNRGIVRGWICCLVGIERLILETYDDPQWVHELLRILQARKLTYIRSLAGAKYDIHELGGGDASDTVISPAIFDHFVAPYDRVLIEKIHEAGQRVSYHTCGGMMSLLERIADMQPDAMETFTPSSMGGNADLMEAKRRIGSKVCLIGGFDQFNFFCGCTPQQTRAAVRKCFAEAGQGGGYILCPSDNFFDADPELIKAFADEAQKCTY